MITWGENLFGLDIGICLGIKVNVGNNEEGDRLFVTACG